MTDRDNLPALKPCPFCGSAAYLEHDDKHDRWSVGCTEDGEKTGSRECIGYISLTTFARKSEAIAAWNTRAALSPTIGADDEALIRDFEDAVEAVSLEQPGDYAGTKEALRRRIAGMRARVFDLETQADDRRHENNALRNTNDLLSEVIGEADDEVELIQDLICAPMEKKRAKGIAIRDYIQNMRARAEAAERELAEVRGKAVDDCIDACLENSDCGAHYIANNILPNLKTKEPTNG